jgi:sulfite reductase beta subunit-like hemoprotein
VIRQKQNGFNAVYVRCYLGDATPSQARGVAQIARDFGGGRLRTTITQNLMLEWIPDAAVKTVYQRLLKAGLALPYAQQIADITRCPGADTCNLAITHSKGLAHDITEKVFSNGYAKDPVFKDIVIKISGCMNSCGQHHIADIGFYGASKNFEGKSVPHYQMLVGGRTGLKYSDGKYGERVALIPARRAHEAVKLLLDLFKADRQSGENFACWSDRKGAAFFKEKVAPLQDLESAKSQNPKIFEDLGDDGVNFKVAVGKGECAA